MRRRRQKRYRDDLQEESGGWPPYVPVAERRRQAARKVAAMTKKGDNVAPIIIVGRTIAATFWGKAWCDNLESYMDFANRLPRGRTYVRNGSVVDLKIAPGEVKALVSGSSLYHVAITVKPLDEVRWQSVIKRCAGKIDSMVELLQGRLSKGVMETVTSRELGLFPAPEQISMTCSCPDYATMCKHVAATLYGVGSRLDSEPELLFLLRRVDHVELITKASASTAIDNVKAKKGNVLESADLGSIFGIELDSGETPQPFDAPMPKRAKAIRNSSQKSATTKSATRKNPLKKNGGKTKSAAADGKTKARKIRSRKENDS